MPSANYGLEQNQVSAIFQSVLQRAATAAEIATWATYLDTGQLGMASVVANLVGATEVVGNVYPVVRLYQAFFGRAPDAAGLRFWTVSLENGVPLYVNAANFANSAEFIADYGLNINPTTFVTALYQNVLGRAPDAAGLAYWVGTLSGGTTATAEGNAVLAFSQSAEFINDTTNSVNYWLSTLANSAVGATTAAAAGSAGASLYSGRNGATGTPVSGATVTMTTGPDVIIGSTGVINGVIDLTNPANTTWNPFDTIATLPGATFNLTMVGNAASSIVTGYTATGVASLNLLVSNAVSGATLGFDAGGMTGLTGLSIANAGTTPSRTGSFTVKGLPLTMNLLLAGNGAYEGVTVNWAAAPATTTPTPPTGGGTAAPVTVALGLNGAGAGAVTFKGPTGSTGIQTVAITTSGATNSIGGLGVISAAGIPSDTALTVTGSGGLSIGTITGATTLDNTLTSVTSTGETGPVFLNLNLQYAGASFPSGVLTAAGNAAASPVASPVGTATITNNTLVLSTNQSLTNKVVLSGFPTVLVNPTATLTSGFLTTTPTLDASKYGDVTVLGIVPGTSPASTVNFTNVVGTSLLQFSGLDITGSGSTSFAGTGWAATPGGSTSPPLTVNINNSGTATTGTLTVGAATNGISASGVGALSIVTADARNVIINGLADVNPAGVQLSFSGPANLTVNGWSDGGSLSSVNASGLTGSLSFGLAAADTGNLTFTGGPGNETITLNAPVAASKAQTFNTGNGNDIYILAAQPTASSTLSINFGSGNDGLNVLTQSGSNPAGTIFLNGGIGADTLNFTGIATAPVTFTAGSTASPGFAGFSGIQFLQNSSYPVTAALYVLSGYSPTLAITDTAAVTGDTVQFLPPTGGRITLTNVTWNGAATQPSIAGFVAGTGGSLIINAGTLGGSDTITPSSSVVTTIALGAGHGGSNTVNFNAYNQAGVVVTQDVPAQDKLHVSGIDTGLTTAGALTAPVTIGAAAAQGPAAAGTTYILNVDTTTAASLTTAGVATITIAQMTGSTTAVATFLNERFTLSAGGQNNLYVFNETGAGNTTTSYIFDVHHTAASTTAAATEVTLVGLVTHGAGANITAAGLN